MTRNRDWTILLIGGSVGTGKTTLSIALAAYFGARAIEGDLFRLVLLSTIPKELEPDLHLFSEPGVWARPVDELVERSLRSDQYLCRAAELVLARQATRNVPSVLEAAWLLPEFAMQEAYAGRLMTGQVKSLFLFEPDIEAVRERVSQRIEWWNSFPAEERSARLAFFHAFGLETKRRAEALGLPVLESRPFDTLLDRALAALEKP